MNEYKSFTQRIGLIGITNLIVSLSGFILLPILTKTFPIEEYGLWVQVSVTIGLITAITRLGLPYAMVRFLAAEKNKEDIKEIFYSIFFIILFVCVIVSALLFAFSELIAEVLFNGHLAIARILPLIIFVGCLNQVLLAFFRTFQHIKKCSIFSIMQTYLSVAFVAYFVLTGHGIIGATIGLLLANILVFLWFAFFILLEIGIKIPKFRNVKKYLVFGVPTVPGNLSNWIIESSDRYIIGMFLGIAFVGYYSPSYTLGSIIIMFAAPLGFMLPAVLSKYYDEKNIKMIKSTLKHSLKYFLAIAIPTVFGLSLLSKPILTVLSTPEIAVHGYLITPFVAVGAVFIGMSTIIGQSLFLNMRTDIGGKIWIIAALLNLGLNIIFIPKIGLIGAAITTLLAYGLVFVISTYYAFKHLTFDVDIIFILKSIFASVIMSLVIIQWQPIGLLHILMVIGVCVVIYSVILFLIGGVKKDEIKFFCNIIKKD